MEAVKDAISAVRARRAEMNVPPSRKAKIIIVSQTPEIYAGGRDFITRLAYASEVEVQERRLRRGPEGHGHAWPPTTPPSICLWRSWWTSEKELERIAKEMTKARGESGAHREEAAERELRVQGPGGGGQCRAGEGRQGPCPHCQAGGIRPGNARLIFHVPAASDRK